MRGRVVRSEIYAAIYDGNLTLLHRPEWMSEHTTQMMHMANAGCINSAVSFVSDTLSGRWDWRIGYDNLAELTPKDESLDVIRVISLSPAHALLIASMQAIDAEGKSKEQDDTFSRL